MITINFKKSNGSWKSFQSKGHAGYAQSGSDIVCAGVSALLYTTVNMIYEQLKVDSNFIQDEDGMSFEVYDIDDRTDLLIESLFQGLIAIDRSYPEYIEIYIKEE